MKRDRYGPPVRAMVISAGMFAALVTIVILMWFLMRPDQPVRSAPAASSGRGASFAPLIGNWARDDGEYTIRVRAVQADGRVEAAYRNPGPIHVAEARASADNGSVTLFVELRDVGYPGSNYHLTFRPGDDTLVGAYFQATARERYDVVFRRVRN